jgi:hypothetical protein
MMRKQQSFIIVLVLWLIIVSVIMILAQRVDLEIFFVLGMIGMLVIVQLMQSDYVEPDYIKYFSYLITVGTVMFGIMIALKILNIIGWEIV